MKTFRSFAKNYTLIVLCFSLFFSVIYVYELIMSIRAIVMLFYQSECELKVAHHQKVKKVQKNHNILLE